MKRPLSISLGLLMIIFMSGCTTQRNMVHRSYDPKQDARVRVYFGVDTKFYLNTDCIPERKWSERRDSGFDVAPTRLFKLSNTTLGMPVPEDAYRFYDEYVVTARQPLLIRMQRGRTWRTQYAEFREVYAKPETSGVFVPKAGVDYEVFADQRAGGFSVTVRRLRLEDHQVKTEPVEIDPAGRCQS